MFFDMGYIIGQEWYNLYGIYHVYFQPKLVDLGKKWDITDYLPTDEWSIVDGCWGWCWFVSFFFFFGYTSHIAIWIRKKDGIFVDWSMDLWWPIFRQSHHYRSLSSNTWNLATDEWWVVDGWWLLCKGFYCLVYWEVFWPAMGSRMKSYKGMTEGREDFSCE